MDFMTIGLNDAVGGSEDSGDLRSRADTFLDHGHVALNFFTVGSSDERTALSHRQNNQQPGQQMNERHEYSLSFVWAVFQTLRFGQNEILFIDGIGRVREPYPPVGGSCSL